MRKLQLALVTVIILGLILGPMGCRGGPAGDLTEGIAESIIPASRASGVAADTAVTIQFSEPIWVSEEVEAPGEEQVQAKQSSELADRFKVINATTGEIVEGTVTIENETELTFELSPGAEWEPHTTYWIMATSGISFEEAYSEGAAESLFFSAFTTQDMDEDEFPVKHPFPGSFPTLLNDVAFDVDTSASLSFEELKAKSKLPRVRLTRQTYKTRQTVPSSALRIAKPGGLAPASRNL